MKVLLCAPGTRGDAQPILALAVELRSLGHKVKLCVSPRCKEWVESFGMDCVSVGPSMEPPTSESKPKRPMEPWAEGARQFAAEMVHSQFRAVADAAPGCDLIVAGGPQFAARSAAEALRVPHVFATYCPAVLPSPDHPPPPLLGGAPHRPGSPWANGNVELWEEDERRWNELFSHALNQERARAGLAPIESVQRYVFTDTPWLAADATLAPAAQATNMHILQTGAWLLAGRNSLPGYVEEFLAGGEAPVYLGFGSMPASKDTSRVLVEATRALGLRSVLAQGWGNLSPIDTGSDCLSIGEIAHDVLLPRVAAVVHHGGAGTTTAAARAGRAQLVIPHRWDQYYWAERVQHLGIGVAGPSYEELGVPSVTAALRECLRTDISVRAKVLAACIERNGARIAAARLVEEFGYVG